MRCVKCGTKNCKTWDSRKILDDRVVKRRRKCDKCGHRWVTYEFALSDIYTQDLKEMCV